MDRQLREAMFEDVMIAENNGSRGEVKIKEILEHIRKVGGWALICETKLTKVEHALIPPRGDQMY